MSDLICRKRSIWCSPVTDVGNQLSQRLADVMRAEVAGRDLTEGPFGVHVWAMREDGTLYALGSVSFSALAQSPDAALDAIERVKFSDR